MPQLETSPRRAAETQIKVDVIQAEPEATAKRTSSQDNIVTFGFVIGARKNRPCESQLERRNHAATHSTLVSKHDPKQSLKQLHLWDIDVTAIGLSRQLLRFLRITRAPEI